MRFQKFVKLTAYAYNSLTNFEFEVHKMTENGTYDVNHLKTCLQKFVKSHQVNLFLAGYGH